MTASQDLITRIRDAANGRWAEIFATLGIAVGEGKHQPCPVCGGTDRFRFDDRDGRGTYFCNQCRPEAGDGFSLVQRVRGCPFLVAVNLVAQALGVSPVDKGPKQRKRRPIIRPGPPEGRLGVNLFEYPDGTGMPVIYVQRFERQDGEKFFVQWGRTSDGVGWQNNLDHAPYPRPLYRLNDLNATDPIVFHEGEKAVHAAIEANLPGNHTTTLGGAKNAKHADCSSIVGRDVIICLDHDKDGEYYGSSVAVKCRAAQAAPIRLLRLPDLPPKGDVKEWLDAGGTASAFQLLLETAPLWNPEGAEETKGTKPSLASAILSSRELLALDLPQRREYLPWLHAGSLVMTYGPRGIGKTMFTLGLGIQLASGDSFLTWSIPQTARVLYVDGEMRLDELKQRLRAFTLEVPEQLSFLTGEWFYQQYGRNLVLTHEVMRNEVLAFLNANPDIGVLILDNISCLFAGLNEDKKQDWEPINAWLIQLRHRGIATILVHHAGKGGTQRGTSGREDALDVVIKLDPPEDYEASEGCRFQLRFTKVRAVKGNAVSPLEVQLSQAGDGVQWEYRALAGRTLDQVIELVKAGWDSPTKVGKQLGFSKGYAFKLMKAAKGKIAAERRVSF